MLTAAAATAAALQAAQCKVGHLSIVWVLLQQGDTEVLATGSMQPWGLDALLALTGPQHPGTRFLGLQGSTATPVEIAGVCTDQATLLLHLLPDGLLCQVTAQVSNLACTWPVFCRYCDMPSSFVAAPSKSLHLLQLCLEYGQLLQPDKGHVKVVHASFSSDLPEYASANQVQGSVSQQRLFFNCRLHGDEFSPTLQIRIFLWHECIS